MDHYEEWDDYDVLENDEEEDTPGMLGGIWRRVTRDDRRRAPLSSVWARPRTKHAEADKSVQDMLEILGAVHNLLKIHGLPRETKVGLAMLGHMGAGCAGFEDLPNFRNPFIRLDKAVYEDCDADEIMNVYCGIGLHEASHIIHSREIYDRMRTEKNKGLRAMWEGLLEDERIEELAKKESPGYAPYLHATKRALFEKKQLGNAFDKWDELPDRDRTLAVIFSFIRCPYLFTDEAKKFTTLSGVCVYEELKKVLDKMPDTEKDVARLGGRLEKFWNSLIKDEKDSHGKSDEELVKEMMGTPGAGGGSGEGSEGEGSEGSGGGGDPSEEESENSDEGGEPKTEEEATEEVKERRERQAEADKQDGEHAGTMEEIEKIAKELNRHGSKSSEEATRKSVHKGTAEEEKLSKKLSKEEDKIDGRGERFGLIDLKQMMDRMEAVSSPLSTEEAAALAKAENERMEFGKTWDSREGGGSSSEDRRTVIVHPVADANSTHRYNMAKAEVKGHIQKMKNVFQFRLGTKVFKETELAEGRIHRKMLSRGMSTNRIFTRSSTRTDKGISLCLLLDNSGSMGSVSHSHKARNVLTTAVTIAEALKGVPGVELEVYSFDSCGGSHEDCYIKYLYGKNNPKIEGIGHYGNGGNNYDHMAIRTATDLFIKNTTNSNRMMIVMSDGQPCGMDYGGYDALRATKKSVQDAEKKGIYTMQVAIDSVCSEEMFKHFVTFTDMNDLIKRMRKLITRVIKRTTEGR